MCKKVGVAVYSETLHLQKQVTLQSLWKTVWQLLSMLNIELSYDSAIPPQVYIQEK